MKTFIITRFSILDTNTTSWAITRENENEKLKEKLFSKDRLDEKFKSFENITYKSVINQTNQNFIWIITISTHLPKEYKNRLYEITSKNNNIEIYEVGNMKEFYNLCNTYNYPSNYSTTRLDDDDALNINFIKDLNIEYNKSIEKNEIYSLVNGNKITIHNGQLYIDKNKEEFKNIALGLSKFNGNIYSCGNHNKVHEKYKVIYNKRDFSYLLYSSDFCDTKRKFDFDNATKINNILDILKQ